MGLNLVVYRMRAGKVIHEARTDKWDWIRHAGDREFAKEVLGDPSKTDAVREDGYEGEWYFRPRDVDAWKAWDAAHEGNNGRWAALADLLASDPELYVYQSW